MGYAIKERKCHGIHRQKPVAYIVQPLHTVKIEVKFRWKSEFLKIFTCGTAPPIGTAGPRKFDNAKNFRALRAKCKNPSKGPRASRGIWKRSGKKQTMQRLPVGNVASIIICKRRSFKFWILEIITACMLSTTRFSFSRCQKPKGGSLERNFFVEGG